MGLAAIQRHSRRAISSTCESKDMSRSTELRELIFSRAHHAKRPGQQR